jgi:transcriptional regulator with XRE-family HTH domain
MDEKMDVLLRFGQRVRERRSILGLSQETFADKCKLDRTYISGIERGKRNVALPYYTAMRNLHVGSGRTPQEPIRDRNLGTTVSNHIKIFERFWRKQLAAALGVPESDVGPRKVQFRKHRSKNFDVCWPPTGDPLILISVKSMQNAYRNLTNRVEEAFGDSAVLRLYKSNAVFGFFFFILNGKVAAGQAEQGISMRTTGAKGVAPYLEPIEEVGDFFDLSDVDRYRKESSGRKRKEGRQDPSVRPNNHSLTSPLPNPPNRAGFIRRHCVRTDTG